MNRHELTDMILGIVQTLNESDTVFLDTNFRWDLGFDDTYFLHLQLLIEDKLDVNIPDEDWRDMETVAHIVGWRIQNQPDTCTHCLYCNCNPCRCDEVDAVTEALDREGLKIS